MYKQWYATGYKTKTQAIDALRDMFAEGLVSEAEEPLIGSYKGGKTRKIFYGIYFTYVGV